MKHEEKKVCYLSGAITSDPDYRERFYKVEEKYLALGYEVINPVRIDDESGVDLTDWKWSNYMARDINILLNSNIDTIVMLPTWKQSKGACIELYNATMILESNVIYEKGE